MANKTINQLEAASTFNTADSFPVYNTALGITNKVSGQNFIKNMYNNTPETNVSSSSEILFFDEGNKKTTSIDNLGFIYKESESQEEVTLQDIFGLKELNNFPNDNNLNRCTTLGKYYSSTDGMTFLGSPFPSNEIIGDYQASTCPIFSMKVEKMTPTILRQTIQSNNNNEQLYAIRDGVISNNTYIQTLDTFPMEGSHYYTKTPNDTMLIQNVDSEETFYEDDSALADGIVYDSRKKYYIPNRYAYYFMNNTGDTVARSILNDEPLDENNEVYAIHNYYAPDSDQPYAIPFPSTQNPSEATHMCFARIITFVQDEQNPGNMIQSVKVKKILLNMNNASTYMPSESGDKISYLLDTIEQKPIYLTLTEVIQEQEGN